MSAAQIILITGANTGLGLEITKALYAEATLYTILIGCRDTAKGEQAKSEVQQDTKDSKSTLEVIQIDVSSDKSIQSAVDHVTSAYGKLDVLINNAGANLDGALRDGHFSIREAWNNTWDVNVTGAQVTTSLFVPLLLKSSQPRLLFITSGTSPLAFTEKTEPPFAIINATPEAGWPKKKSINPTEAYRSTKAGLNMMMRQWYRILKKDGVKVFAVSPGFLATGLGGIGVEKLKQIGALDPSVGGKFVKDVVQGKRDDDEGKAINANGIQPW